MSKGLGSSFLTPQMIKYFKDDPTRPVTLLEIKKSVYLVIIEIRFLMRAKSGLEIKV